MSTPIAPETPDLSTFGAPYLDADAVVDPETEMAASAMNLLATQVVATGHTAPRAWALCTISGGVITLADHDAVWGSGAGVAPVAARSSAGVYTVTWASAYDDLQDVPESHSTILRAAVASGYAAAGARIVNGYLSSAIVATVKAYDAAGVAADVDTFTVTVW